MKAVVLAAGYGTRMRPIAYSMAKQLIPVANKPILFYGLEDIAAAGIVDTVVVVAPETGDAIREAVGDGSRFGLAVEYVTQREPLGIADALGAARHAVGDRDILLYLGDSLLKCGVGDHVSRFRQTSPNCQILLSRIENPQRFGVVTLDKTGNVRELVEKPEYPSSDLALAGAYFFDSSIWAAIDSLQPSHRGEYEITEAIQYLVDSGKTVTATEVSGWWKDTGQKEDLLHANSLILADLTPSNRGTVEDSVIVGAVAIGVGSVVRNSRVTGPLVIGRNATITDSELGPGTAIGDDCTLVGAAVTRSVILAGTRIERWNLESSLLGRGVAMIGSGPAEAISVMLGERSEVVGR